MSPERKLQDPQFHLSDHPGAVANHNEAKMLSSALLGIVAGLLGTCAAHGDHGGQQKIELDEHADWMMRHMAGTFFVEPGRSMLGRG